MLRPTSILALSFFLGAQGAELPKDWMLHESKEGNFTVAMPGKPLEQRQLVKTGLGTLEATMVMSEYKKEAAFVVSFADFPEAAIKDSPETRLDLARDGAVTTARGKLRDEKKIKLGDHQGRELIIDSETRGTLRIRMFAADKRLYQALVVGSKTFVTGEEAETFLTSFKLGK